MAVYDEEDVRDLEEEREIANFEQSQAEKEEKESLADRLDRVGLGYNDATKFANKRARGFVLFKLRTNRKLQLAILGSLAGVVLPIAFIIFMLTGTSQFVHFAQILQKAHFTATQAHITLRGAQLIKYSRTIDATERRSLGYFGNQFADRAEAKMKRAGMTPVYENNRITKLIIDADTVEGKKSLAGLQQQGVNVNNLPKNSDGKVTVNMEGTSARHRRAVLTASVNNLDMGRTASFMHARVLKLRGLVNFAPLKNIVRKQDESIRQYRDRVKEEKAKEMKTGAKTGSMRGSAEQATDSDGNSVPNPEAEGAINEVNETIEGEGPASEKASNLKRKMQQGMGPLGVVSMICAVKGLGDMAPDIQQENINDPLTRMGMDVITTGSNIQAPDAKKNLEEMSAYSEIFYDHKTGTGFNEARSIQAELGQPQDGPDIPDAAKPGKDKPGVFKVMDSVIGAIPGGNTVCDGVNSTLGGFVISVGSVMLNASGPLARVAEGLKEAGLYLGGNALLGNVIKWMNNDQIDYMAAGAEAGSYANYGSRLAAGQDSIAVGGIEMTPAETAALDSELRIDEKNREKNKSFYARYLDINSPSSLVAKTIFETPKLNKNIASVNGFVQLPSILGGMFAQSINNLGFKNIFAAEGFDYGFPEYGFTLEEINDPKYEDPYKNEALVIPHLEMLNSEYGEPCFKVTIDPTTFKVNNDSKGSVNIAKIPEKCNDRNNELLTRYRFYLSDMTTANCIANYENIDEEGCNYGSAQNQASATGDSSVVGDASLKETITVNKPGKFITLPSKYSCAGRTTKIDSRIAASLAYLLDKYDMCADDGLANGHKSHGAGLGVDIRPKDQSKQNNKEEWIRTVEAAAKDMGWWGDSATEGKTRNGCAPAYSGYGACVGGNRSIPKWVRWIGYNGDVDHGDPWHVFGGSYAHIHIGWASPNGTDAVSGSMIGTPIPSVYTFPAPVPEDIKGLIE